MMLPPVFQIVPDLLKKTKTEFVVFVAVSSISIDEKTSK